MRTAKEYREIAKNRIKPFSDQFAVIYFLLFAIEGILAALGGTGSMNLFIEGFIYPGVVSNVASSTIALILVCVSGPLAIGLIHLQVVAKEDKEPEIKDVLYGFRHFTKGLLVTLWQVLYIFLWSLLLIVPGIIAAYRYSLSYYLIHDNPDLSEQEAIEKSKMLMVGKKWKLFCLDLSYLGWFILSGLTLGLLSFWVMPKYHAARYAFYLDILEENKNLA